MACEAPCKALSVVGGLFLTPFPSSTLQCVRWAQEGSNTLREERALLGWPQAGDKRDPKQGSSQAEVFCGAAAWEAQKILQERSGTPVTSGGPVPIPSLPLMPRGWSWQNSLMGLDLHWSISGTVFCLVISPLTERV